MRRIISNKEEAKQKGKKAREDIINYYSEQKVFQLILNQLTNIKKKIQKF